MCSPVMFMRNVCPLPVIRSVWSSLRTNPDPSTSGWRAGSVRTSKISLAGAGLARDTLMDVAVSAIHGTYPYRANHQPRSGPSQPTLQPVWTDDERLGLERSHGDPGQVTRR